MKHTRNVMCPATPSSNPYLPKILNAAASLPFRYARSLYGSSNLGGPGNAGIFTLAEALSRPGSCGAMFDGLVESSLAGVVAEGGDILK